MTPFIATFWQIMVDLAPSLLLGLLIAGLLHSYLPPRIVHANLNPNTLGSAFKAALIGVPMPLCSCGVIPTALELRRQGASHAATVSFIISTPQTGVDSILVSASFLGWPFALFKVVAAFITGILGGYWASLVSGNEPRQALDADLHDRTPNRHPLMEALHYAVFDLLAMIDLWIVLGVVAAVLISLWVPADYFASWPWAQGTPGMLVVLAIAIPLYVCNTGSVPIAASLIAAGLPAGSALVFLMAGPATNVATMGAIYRVLGSKMLGIYLATIMMMSLGLGWMMQDTIGAQMVGHVSQHQHHETGWLDQLSAWVILALLTILLARRLRDWVGRRLVTTQLGGAMQLKVEGMTCGHCAANVEKAVLKVTGVTAVVVQLGDGKVQVTGDGVVDSAVVSAVENAGYKVVGVEAG